MYQTKRGKNMDYSISTHNIVSKTAYLLGVDQRFFRTLEEENRYLYLEIFQEMDRQKAAQIVRHLCILRTQIEQNFRNINDAMKYQGTSIHMLSEYVSQESLQILEKNGIRLKQSWRLTDYIIEINRNIQDRINNCKSMFPSWLEWNYLRDIFIMPDGLKEEGTRAAVSVYYNHKDYYPFQVYMNWRPADEGNILYSDMKFVPLLYAWNGDEFTDYGYLTHLDQKTRLNIRKFLESSKKTVIVVDCENADPYRFHSVLEDLNGEQLQSVAKILLYNDRHTTIAWHFIGKKLSIPVDEVYTERVLERKSLVDIALTAGTCREFYENGVDSFILVSSDSDYFGLISALPQARFLVMMEREHCSKSLQDALSDSNIFYCFMEDFPQENSDALKETVILLVLRAYFDKAASLNLDNILNEIITSTRAELSDAARKELRSRLARNLRLEIDPNGKIRIEFNPK